MCDFQLLCFVFYIYKHVSDHNIRKIPCTKVATFLRNVAKYQETAKIPVGDGFPKLFQYSTFNTVFIYSFIFESWFYYAVLAGQEHTLGDWTPTQRDPPVSVAQVLGLKSRHVPPTLDGF